MTWCVLCSPNYLCANTFCRASVYLTRSYQPDGFDMIPLSEVVILFAPLVSLFTSGVLETLHPLSLTFPLPPFLSHPFSILYSLPRS